MTAPAKPFLGVLYDCCNVYARVYLNRDGSAFQGRCPRCGRQVVVPVAQNGSTDRFLRAN